MGNAHGQPTNKTGRKVVAQKVENAKKTGVLSLSEHKLDDVPDAVFEISKLRTLDLSKNFLTRLPQKTGNLKELKTINLENNQIPPGALGPIANLPNLQNLQLSGNILGKPTPELAAKLKAAQNDPTHPPLTLPELPTGLKQVTLASNHLSHIPRAVMTNHLTKLVKLDLSNNSLAAIPTEIVKLKNLTEIVADDNAITSLPKAIGLLTDLKVLSLKNNKISAGTYPYSEKNPQPLPASLFTDTKVIDLNLHGNPLTNTELNRMEGFEKFLERRQAVKTTTLLGGGLTSMTTCGLE